MSCKRYNREITCVTCHFSDTSGLFPDVYVCRDVEQGWYPWWEHKGYFQAAKTKTGAGTGTTNFSLVLPPPNVTGTLHLGHALTCAIQDALVRW